MPFFPLGQVGSILYNGQEDAWSRAGILMEPDRYIRSRNYDVGVTGWTINADGTAEFNSISLVTSLYSADWDGTIPIDLTTEDTGAAAGWALDAVTGNVQIEGDVWLGGSLLVSGGAISTAASGQRIVITNNDRINFYTGLAAETNHGYILADNSSASNPRLTLQSPTTSASGHTILVAADSVDITRSAGTSVTVLTVTPNAYGMTVNIGNYFEVGEVVGGTNAKYTKWYNGGTTYMQFYSASSVPGLAPGLYLSNGTIISNTVGSASAPSYQFSGDGNSGFYHTGTADIWSAAAGGVEIMRFQENNSSLSASGAKGITAIQQTTLSSTAGTDITTFGVGGPSGTNNVYLDIGQLRHTTGTSWTDMAMFIRRRTDSTEQGGLYFDQSCIGINDSNPALYSLELAVNGQIGSKPTTTGSTNTGQWVSPGGSYYEWRRFTSSRRYKFDIDYDPRWENEYANLKLPSLTRHGRIDAESENERFIGMIAEDLSMAHPRLVTYNEEGLPETPDQMQLINVLVAKVKRLEEQMTQLRSA